MLWLTVLRQFKEAPELSIYSGHMCHSDIYEMQVLPARTTTSPSLGCFLMRRAPPAFSPASSSHPDGHLDSSAYIYCHPASLTASELLSHLASSSASMHLSLSRSAFPDPLFFFFFMQAGLLTTTAVKLQNNCRT